MLGNTDDSGTLRYNLDGNAKMYVTGDLAMLQVVLDGLSSSQIESTLISLAVSFLVLFMLTRRLLPAIVILFPVGIASLWVVGSMAAIGLKWNVMTVMVGINTWNRYRLFYSHVATIEVELSRRNNHWDALRASISTTGVALIMSALTTSLGFMVLLFSPMPVIQDFWLDNSNNCGIFVIASLGSTSSSNGIICP